MKVAFIRYPQELYKQGRVLKGGSEIANQYVIDYLRSVGVEVKEFSPKTEKRINLFEISGIGTPLMFQDLLKEIDEINKCDVIVLTNWFGAIIPEFKKPVVVIFHSCASLMMEATQEDILNKDKILTKWLKKVKLENKTFNSFQNLHELIISVEEQYFANKANRIIVVSSYLKNKIVQFYGASADKIDVILNTYPRDWGDVAITKDRDIKLINVTRMPIDRTGFGAKGIDRILDIFNKVNGVDKIMLASTKEGFYRDFMSKNAKDVKFVENASRQLVGEYLASSHISVHTSRCESFQLPLVESMIMGIVPITFPIGVAEELIYDGENGYVVKNVDEAVKKINYLIKNHGEIERIGKNARKTILNNLSVEKIGELYKSVLESVVSSN